MLLSGFSASMCMLLATTTILFSATISYQEDSSNFPNPERGYYIVNLSPNSLQAARKEGMVDLLYRYLPRGVSRWLSRGVDALRCAFLATMTVLTVMMMRKMGNYPMTIVDLPINIVYGVCLFGFAAMTVRSVWVSKVHWQRGYSVLERPEATMEER